MFEPVNLIDEAAVEDEPVPLEIELPDEPAILAEADSKPKTEINARLLALKMKSKMLPLSFETVPAYASNENLSSKNKDRKPYVPAAAAVAAGGGGARGVV